MVGMNGNALRSAFGNGARAFGHRCCCDGGGVMCHASIQALLVAHSLGAHVQQKNCDNSRKVGQILRANIFARS